MKKYSIKKGSFVSGWRFWPLLFQKDFNVKVKFSKECLYEAASFDQINKLVGFSRGLWHHYSSVRIGWNCDVSHPGVISLWRYEYAEGKRLEPVFHGVVAVETEFTVSLTPTWIGYRLYPYFGGQKPAPHDMDIYLEFL